MSGKVKNKGSSNYDTHNNIMALEGDLDDQMKYKINKVMEVVKNRSQDDVMLVLQYFDYDIDTTVDAFLEDGASDILKKWNHTNSIKPTNKNKKKNKKKKKSSAQDIPGGISESASNGGAEAVSLANGVASVSPLETGSSHNNNSNNGGDLDRDTSVVPCSDQDTRARLSPTPDSHTDDVKIEADMSRQEMPPPVSRLAEQTAAEPEDVKSSSSTVAASESSFKSTTPDSTTDRSSLSPSDHPRSTNRNRHRSSGSQSRMRQESTGTDAAPPQTSASIPISSTTTSTIPATSQAPGKKILEKSLKDLSRQTVALHRVSNLLEEELDNSFKRIKTAIAEAQRLLEDRSQDLEKEMERVKKESRHLLSQRKDLAAELRQRAERASTMGEAELNELRADIKHFVVERKYDEELGKTCRFMWDKDRITEEIKTFGEVHHVKNVYSQRRQSVSSVASSSNMTFSITEPPESSPINQTELDQEIAGPHPENVVPDTRPPGRARFFFSRRNYANNDSNRQPYSRGTYPPRGRGGGRGNSRGARREDGYRGSHDTSYYSKPHHNPQGKSSDEQGSSASASTENGSTGVGPGGWPPRDQRAPRRGRYNTRFPGRMHHSPRRNYGSHERVAAAASNESHVNGKEESSSDLLNGFVDH